MSARMASWIAWAVCALTLVLIVCAVVFAVLNRTDVTELTYVIAVASCAVVGAVVTSRRPRNLVGWFFVGSASSFAVQQSTDEYATYGLLTEPGALPLARAMAWPQTWAWVPGVVLVLTFLPLYFPDGRLISRRWRPVTWFAIFFSVTAAGFYAFGPGEVGDDTSITNPLGVEALRPVVGVLDIVMPVLFVGIILASVSSLVVRFRRSAGEERQQMKWLTYAAAAMAVMVSLVNLVDAVNLALFGAVDLLTSFVFAGIPVAAGIAILKYRLYDIDRIVNRTLVYGSLTAMLALVYLGSVVLLQALLRALTGQESQLAIVASTLGIAALFGPLRRRVQTFIDHRFYRKKYDAAKTLAAFGAKLRDETDLDALGDELLAAVRETVQPEHVSLWMRPARVAGSGDPAEEPR